MAGRGGSWELRRQQSRQASEEAKRWRDRRAKEDEANRWCLPRWRSRHTPEQEKKESSIAARSPRVERHCTLNEPCHHHTRHRSAKHPCRNRPLLFLSCVTFLHGGDGAGGLASARSLLQGQSCCYSRASVCLDAEGADSVIYTARVGRGSCKQRRCATVQGQRRGWADSTFRFVESAILALTAATSANSRQKRAWRSKDREY
jgi:hypothetical protein